QSRRAGWLSTWGFVRRGRARSFLFPAARTDILVASPDRVVAVAVPATAESLANAQPAHRALLLSPEAPCLMCRKARRGSGGKTSRRRRRLRGGSPSSSTRTGRGHPATC